MAPRRRVSTPITRTYSNPGRAARMMSLLHPLKKPIDAYRMRVYDNGQLNLEYTPSHLVDA
jgi:hypothetical protein